MSETYEKLIQSIRAEAQSGVLPSYLATHPFTPELRLGELGIDSLGKIALLTAVMDETDKYLPDDSFRDENTLQEVADFVENAP